MDPIVIGRTSDNVAESVLSGTAINIIDMIIKIIGRAASILKKTLPPPTLNGRSALGSILRSLRNDGKTGR